MNLNKQPIVVLGAGSWGTALAIQLMRHGGPVTMWGHEPDHMADIAAQRSNERYLPGITLPEALIIEPDLEIAVKDVQDILVAVPSHAFRSVLVAMQPFITGTSRLTWATKGLEAGSGKLLHEVATEVLGEKLPLAVISGPTFAREVAEGLPAAVTIASENEELARDMAERFHTQNFRAYTSDDVVGVEIGGAVKNVLAIATGIADGLGFGANTRAALITRGLAEMMRLADAVGNKQNGHKETLMGLAGLGDLVLTCTDNQSRNRRFGLALGKGDNMEKALADIDQVVEGVQTAREVFELAQREAVDMPITEQVYEVLYESRSPKEAVQKLLARVQKAELS
jgi:glycerol-3-phosphate dehydrogenase (NAD(P)+)